MRYPVGKPRDVNKVTIALGMLAGGNVVIAADTQIGIPEYLNARGNKVAWASRSSEGEQDAAMAITGAGNTHCVDHLKNLKNEFTGAFTTDWDAVSNTKNFKEYAAGHLNEFYRKHVKSFALYGADRPEVDLIIGYADRFTYSLWSSERNLLNEHQRYATAGVGAMWANAELGRIYSSSWHPTSPNTAMLLAAYVVFQVKEHVDGCGKDTDVVCINNRTHTWLTRQQVVNIEDLLKSSRIEETFMWRIFSDEKDASTRWPISREIRKIRSSIAKILSSRK